MLCTAHVILLKFPEGFFFPPPRRGKSGTDKKKRKKHTGEKDARKHETRQQPPKQDRELSKTSAIWSENRSEVK